MLTFSSLWGSSERRCFCICSQPSYIPVTLSSYLISKRSSSVIQSHSGSTGTVCSVANVCHVGTKIPNSFGLQVAVE